MNEPDSSRTTRTRRTARGASPAQPEPGARAQSGRGRVGGGRQRRSIVLGALAVVFSIAWLARELGLDRDELLGFARSGVLFVVVLAGGGAVLGLLLALLRRLRLRR